MGVPILVRNPATATLLGGVVFLLLQGAVVLSGFPATLILERAFPVNRRIELSQLRERDSLRHHTILQQQSSTEGVIVLPVEGNYDPLFSGLYYTKVRLGSPLKEYYVQIDTGSDVLWVDCTPCKRCPTSSGLPIPITFYDPSTSSTSSPISCSDERCWQFGQYFDSSCSNHKCSNTLKYEGGSATSGYYVST